MSASQAAETDPIVSWDTGALTANFAHDKVTIQFQMDGLRNLKSFSIETWTWKINASVSVIDLERPFPNRIAIDSVQMDDRGTIRRLTFSLPYAAPTVDSYICRQQIMVIEDGHDAGGSNDVAPDDRCRP